MKEEQKWQQFYQEMYELSSGNSQLAIFRPHEAVGCRWVEGEFDVLQHPGSSKGQ